jgi:hypothetical protein
LIFQNFEFSLLKTELLVNNIYKLSLYLTENILRLRYKGQPVNVVWGSNWSLLFWQKIGLYCVKNRVVGARGSVVG